MSPVRPLTLLAAVAAPLALSACTPRPVAPDQAAPSAAEPSPGVVSAEAARRLVLAGARVVDVRTPEEFAAGHVPGAVNVPFDQVRERAAELGDPSRPVVLYCRTGRRSGLAADTLRGLGFARVYDFQRYGDWPAGARAAQ